MKKNLSLLVAIVFLGAYVSYSQLATWNFTGDVLTASSSDSNLTASSATQSGLTSTTSFFTCNGSAWSPSSWSNNASVNTSDDYAEYTITANVGFELTVTGFTYIGRRSSSGPQSYSIRSSNNSYASDLLTGTISTSCSSLGGAFGSSITVASGNSLSIRIYGYNASGTGNMRMDDVTITGTSASVSNGPSITNIMASPSNPTSSDAVTISADVIDADGVAGVDINWGTSSGNLTNTVSMSLSSGDTYQGTIPAQAEGTTVFYEIYTLDNNLEDRTSTEQSYSIISGTPPTLTAGDLAIIGVSVVNEEILLVALADIPAGESVFFTDDEWAGSVFNSGEGFYKWETTAISAGTTITLSPSSASDGGAVTQEAGSFTLGNSGDGVFLYQTSTNVYNTGTYTLIGFAGEDSGDAGTLTGTGLTEGTNAIYFGGDNGIFTGNRTINNKAGHLTNIYNAVNWTTSSTAQTFDTAAFVIGTPVPTIGFDAATSSETENDATFTSSNIPITVSNYDGNQIDIEVSVTGGTAEAGDYTFTSPTALSFTANGTQNITIEINDDADTDDETVILTLTETSSVTGLIISQSTHTITINDEDTIPATLTAGDLAIIGVGVDNEEILLVALADIPAGESVFFTDDEWAGSAFNSGEGFYKWETTAISAGTTITLSTSSASDGGAVTQEAGSFNLSNSGDGVYIYQTSTNVYNTGTYTLIGFAGKNAGNAGTLSGTGLTEGTTAIYFGGDNGIYTGDRTANTKVGHLANIYNAANWTTSGTAQTFDTAAFVISVGATSVVLDIDVFLEGPYNTTNSDMNDDLRAAGLIPTTSPYSDGATVASTVFDATGNDAIVDWVFVELRDENDITSVLYSKSGLLQADGDVVDLDGTSSLDVNGSANGTYFVSVNHRNHLAIASATALTLSGTATAIDFTDSANVTGTTNAVVGIDGVFAMIGGDVDESGEIGPSDGNATYSASGTTGYNLEDVNLNGEVQPSDVSFIFASSGSGVQF